MAEVTQEKTEVPSELFSTALLMEQAKPPLFEPGTTVNSEYRIEKHIATGSVADVYLCSHLELKKARFALKVLRIAVSEEEKDLAASLRFKREVRICFQINHPHVVSSYAFLRIGTYYAFVMEYLPGGDLADYIRDHPNISVDFAFKILRQACEGIKAFHQRGIVHRDLKPENLLLGKNGDVKIGDFGIAHIVNSRRLTLGEGVLGTIQYLSPEYLMDAQCDVRGDIYSLGLIVYEMLAGTLPFEGDSIIEILKRKVGKGLQPLYAIRKDCPRELSNLVQKAMEPQPQRRFQNIDQMLRAVYSLRHLQRLN